MLDAEHVVKITGHPVGGVCPFGLASPLPVYCDVPLRSYDQVVPEPGETKAAVRAPNGATLPNSGLRRMQESTDSDGRQRQSAVTGR